MCRAEDQSPILLGAKTAFERIAPSSGFAEYETAFGDVNGDGVTDFVTFIGNPDYNDNADENLTIAVFLGANDNSFNLYGVSSRLYNHVRVSHSLEIKRQSLFLHRYGMGSASSYWIEEFQFKLRNGKLMLIGFETSNDIQEEARERETGISVNLITGRVIKWDGKGKRPEKKAVPSLKPVLFKEFDYHAFMEKLGSVLRCFRVQ